MSTKPASIAMHLDVNPKASAMAAVLDPETPFRILVLGDFSGKTRHSEDTSPWRAIEIDRDNFDDVMVRVAPEFAGIQFTELDDFDPDRIYRESPLFQVLRDARRKLEHPATFAEAAKQIRAWGKVEDAPSAPERPPLPSAGSGMSLLDSILDAEEPEPGPPPRRPDEFQAFVERAVAPFTVPAERPELPRLREIVDEESGLRMRALLHHARFQALEAAWRALYHLVRAAETGIRLKLYVADVSKAELEGDLSAAEDLQRSRAWRLMVELPPSMQDEAGETPWSVIAGNYAFAQSVADAKTLTSLARIASFAGAPLLAEADPAASPADAEAGAAAWQQLRQLPEACWIGLAMPRFLVRLPYGAKTEPLEAFAFEEMPGAPVHQHYLWGNPALLCAELLAEAYACDGTDMSPGAHLVVEGLPVHIYEAEGEKQAKSCAEVWLTERDIDWMLEQGYMPLTSIRERDSVRLVRFQSIADPPARLAGRWE